MNIKKRNIMRTNVGMRIDLGPKGGSPGKWESFTELLKNMGLRTGKSDSSSGSATYVPYDLACDSWSPISS